jgi:hypothetical protein
MNYKDLPVEIQDRLFAAHTHGEIINPEEIVYREKDVLKIIDYILYEFNCKPIK